MDRKVASNPQRLIPPSVTKHKNKMKKYITINKRNHFLIILLSSLFFCSGLVLKAQQNNKVLFLGNSYTGVNNLPQIINDVALSVGDTLIFESNTPGGYQLIDHSLDIVSQNKIMAGGWDYIVLQGQSQEPITNPNDFGNGCSALYNQIRQYNSCTVIMPYMTWGRKNGDANNCSTFPIMCTYEGMDTTLRDKYLDQTSFVNGEVSPVSVVWSYLRQNHPSIELYQADESHPSAAGSYAAACCFYAAIFKKDPTLITYNFSLNVTDASIIKNAAKTIVYDSLSLWDYKRPPIADFGYSVGSGVNEIIFGPINPQVRQNYFWDFGDDTTSTLQYPTHSYLSEGNYTVELTTTNCDLQGTYISFKDTVIQFCSHTPTIFSSHPWLCEYDTLWTEPADAYQWLSGGLPIPESNQYLSNYTQYNISGFSVMSTVNGCSELSEAYLETPEWSGYYFDALGDPCVGDTVAFAVLHINGFLSGSEIILWYKNDTLLSNMSNEDTLLVTAPGTYECKVVDPNSNCPFDTTSSVIEYDCGVGIENTNGSNQNLFLSIFPNPTTGIITIKAEEVDSVEVINLQGKQIYIGKETEIDLSSQPKGIYIIKVTTDKQTVTRKLIKQ
jgi:PKD repeat protein